MTSIRIWNAVGGVLAPFALTTVQLVPNKAEFVLS